MLSTVKIINIMSTKIKSLNGLKVFGYLCVFTSHAHLMLRNKFSVTLFFMISGFLLYYSKNVPRSNDYCITNAENQTLNLKSIVEYVIIHIKKIYPIYLFFFCTSLLIRKEEIQLLANNFQLVWHSLQHVFMLQCFSMQPFRFNYAAWYVSCLFILYWMALPSIYWTKKIESPLKWISILIILYYILDYYILKFEPLLDFAYWNPVYRYPIFLIGMLSGRLFCETRSSLLRLSLTKRELVFDLLNSVIVLTFAIMLLIQFQIPESNNYFTLLFAVSIYVLAYDKGWLCKALGHPLVQWFSNIGLEFYLCHELIIFVVERQIKQLSQIENWHNSANIWLWIVAFPLSIITAYLIAGIHRKKWSWRKKHD